MKQVAAVVVSAAIMLTDLQGVTAAGMEQAFTAETMETEMTDDSAQTGMDEGLPVEDLDAETQTVESVETIQAENIEAVQTEITETETTQVETIETVEAESTQDAVDESQVETLETTIEEVEQIVSEAEEPTDVSEAAVDDEVVAVGDYSQIKFWKDGDPDKTPITEVAISINDPVTIVADFGDADFTAAELSGSKVMWGSSELNQEAPTYVKLVQPDTIGTVNGIKLEGLKPTETGTAIRVTCHVLDRSGEIIFYGDFSVKVNPLATGVFIKIGDPKGSWKNATETDVVYSYEMATGEENGFVSVGGDLLSEAEKKSKGFFATVSPENAKQEVIWKSSNPSIISFADKESGEIEVKGVGDATITAEATDGSNKVGSVNVKVRRLVKGFSFEVNYADKSSEDYTEDDFNAGKEIPIAEGTSLSIKPKYEPNDATLKRLSWSKGTGNANALNITANDETNVLTVTAKTGTKGIATLSAKTTDMSEQVRNIRFRIIPKAESLKILATDTANITTDVTGKSIGYDPETYKSETPNNVYIFSAQALPEGASNKVSWKISNSKIATVEELDDNTYKVEVDPNLTGTAVITATASDGSKVSASTTLRVAPLAQKVEIQGSSVVMKGRSIKLTANVWPTSVGNVKFEWESYNPSVASVNAATGEVTGKTVGIATIVATAMDGSGKSGQFIIRVTDPPKEFDIITVSDNNVVTGKTVGVDPDAEDSDKIIGVKILPETASQKVEWKSSNEKIVTCEEVSNSNGTQIKIHAKAIGTATITAKALDGSGKTASVKVYVNTLVSGITITGGHYVGKDMTLQLKAEIKNADAVNKSVIWKSDAPKIAEVDERGLVTAVGKDGMARITAEAADGSGVIQTHDVYVVSKPNKVEISETGGLGVVIRNNTFDVELTNTDTISLTAELSGGYEKRDNYVRDIKWSTSSKSIATVEVSETNPNLATVKIYKKGTVNITATTTEGFESSATVTIKVKSVNPQVKITGPGTRLARGKKMKLSVGSVLVDWESNDSDIAKVSNKGQVTANKNADGAVSISATAVEGGNADSYIIQIGDPVASIDLTLNGKPIEDTKKKIGVDITKGCANNVQYANTLPDDYSIRLGATLNFADESSETNSTNVTWKTSSKSVATIDENGNVTLKKKGNVTFTATATDGSNKKAKVTFVVSKQMTKMYPVGDVKDIYVGLKKSVQLSKEIEYRPLAATKPKLIWVSSDPDIVSVNKNSGKVTGKMEGESATITATDANNENIHCEFVVHVEAPVYKVEVVKVEQNGRKEDYQSVLGIDLSGEGEHTLSLATNLYAKEDDEDSPSLNDLSSKPVTWTSSNKAVAEVSELGVVTAHKNGQVTITATATDGSKKKGKVKIYCGKLVQDIVFSDTVNGNSINLDLGKKSKKTYNLADKLKIAPVTATNRKLTYTSTDKTVATVNSSGKVTAKGEGSADIIVTSKDGGCSITIPVYVYDTSYSE
ncbi:MAG: hypothetical protein HDR25_00635 [Lachnospiraceae bacterium]|nr:hypothetical protein [Lachnospiraceae bacterium]